MLQTYERYLHAGLIPFADWKESGIVVPVFDKDGTLTHANSHDLVDEVVNGLWAQDFPDLYPDIAVVSNNVGGDHMRKFAAILRGRLGVKGSIFSVADGYAAKPHPAMGLAVAIQFGVATEQLGVIGDRRLTDVGFGRNVGAGMIALCAKAGDGDAKWVPQLRALEAGLVAGETLLGIARSR